MSSLIYINAPLFFIRDIDFVSPSVGLNYIL